MRITRFTLYLVSFFSLSTFSFSATASISGTFWGLDGTFGFQGATPTPVADALGVPLTNGPAGTGDDGDGAIIQIGYFSAPAAGVDPATYTSGDWGSFVALTGNGSLNPEFDTTMGDGGGGAIPDGFYTHTGITFDTAVHDGVLLTAQRIGIRFYDDTSVATSTGYNTVTAADAGWILAGAADLPGAPVSPWMDTSVGLGGLAALSWESGASGAFKTVIPEPSSMLLGLLGGIFLLRRRR
jgi:hypothetical protein